MGYTSVGPISDGAFADYEVIQSLGNNDAYLKSKITNFTITDDSTGSRVYYNESKDNIQLRIRAGQFQWTIPAGTTKNSSEIKISSAIPPNIQLTVYNQSCITVAAYNISNSGFNVQCRNTNSSSKTFTVGWLALCVETVA